MNRFVRNRAFGLTVAGKAGELTEEKAKEIRTMKYTLLLILAIATASVNAGDWPKTKI